MSMKQKNLIYHPKQVPIDIKKVKGVGEKRCECLGELAVQHSAKLAIGSQVLLSITSAKSDLSLHGRVIWIMGSEKNYLIGITFYGEDEAYKMRMLEQLCHIQAYKRKVANMEGRQLSDDEAAREWIIRYSKDFPEVALVH